MEESLSKIRPHVSSSLLHQKQPATLLVALEATFKEQNTEPSPTAYFAALLTTLHGTIQRNDISLAEGDILPAELYLLALILPSVPCPVIRTHLNTLLSLTSPLFPSLITQAPPLRSQLSIYQTILNTIDKFQLDLQEIRQSFISILQLCIDPRPKVRKKAADVIRNVLATPPPPFLCHPYAERVAEWVKTVLTSVNAGPLAKGQHGKFLDSFGAETAIHVLSFLRLLLPVLPTSALPSITTLMLSLPRLGNQYLSHSSYSVLSDLFTLVARDTSSSIGDQIPEVLNIILASPPPKSDATLAPAWVQVLGDSMLAYTTSNAESCENDIGKVWRAVWNYLDSNDLQTRKATVKSIDCLCRSITHNVISTAIADQQGKSMLRRAIIQVDKALDSLTYARAMPEVLAILSSMITVLSYRPGGRECPTSAESLLLPLVLKIGEMRTSKGFEHKEKADATLATAMKIIGPEVLLTALPLNLEPVDRQAGREPRAFLLPLLSQPHPSSLNHFVSYFVPLSERMFTLQKKAELEGRQPEAKVWSVLIAQIWAGLASYCAASPELQKSFPLAFSELLSQLLYTQPDLRPSILKALKVVVESNVALASPDRGGTELWNATLNLSPEEASVNIDFLRTQAESWLAVFFNLFTSVKPDSRGMIGDVIKAWASITSQQDLNKTCQKLVKLFQTTPRSMPINQGNFEGVSVAATTQDILILLLPYLSSSDAEALFQLSLSEEVLSSKDNAIQKRGYKILTKLIKIEKVSIDSASSVLKSLNGLLEGVSQGSKKDRFNLMASIVPHILPDSLYIMPSLIPEVVLGTKEPSEKARSAAFDLIVAMGKKMSEGGSVDRSLVDGIDEEGPNISNATASVEEFVTMIAAGLAGASPHMISATITALSRLVFEFKDSLSQVMHDELLSTMLVFLASTNREIVKSVLGFIKLVVHTIPTEFLRPHLKVLVPALLNRSHDHKNHFKVKVRHIFERLMRRFRWEEIYEFASDNEASKVLVNIKKRKDRAKRKKALEKEGDDDEATPVKPVAGDAFEDVLYGSESEADDSDEDESNVPATISKKKRIESRIRVDDDEPMDLLSGAALRVTGKSKRNLIANVTNAWRRKPGQDAAYFKTDEETGKMIIDESEPEEGTKEDEDVVGNAYRESLTSADGFTRSRNGRIKFNKDTKKRRRGDQEEDIEMDDGTMTRPKKGKKTSETPNLGQAFKAKNAGGDVKKGKVDPYVYLSLAEAAKGKKGLRGKFGIAGKR